MTKLRHLFALRRAFAADRSTSTAEQQRILPHRRQELCIRRTYQRTFARKFNTARQPPDVVLGEAGGKALIACDGTIVTCVYTSFKFLWVHDFVVKPSDRLLI